MAVAHRSTTAANTGSTPAGSLTLNLPAGTTTGDCLLAAVNVNGGSGATITPPAGWTLLSTSTDGTNTQMSVYWRIADGTETSTYQWTFDTTRQAAGTFSAYSGAYPFQPSQVITSTNASASTTLTPPSTNSSYSGRYLTFYGTRNTTATATVTPSTYNERGDTCTTASAFIGVEVQDIAENFSLVGSSVGTSTASQSVTYSCIVLQISDNHGRPAGVSGLQVDTLSFGSRNTSGTGIQALRFNTNYDNEVLIALVSINKDVQTVSSITGNSITWVFVGRTNTQTGSVEVWRAFRATAVPASSAFTVQVTCSGTIISANAVVFGFVGANTSGTNGSGAIGSTASANGTTSAPIASLTTTKNNSLVMGVVSDPSENISVTPGSGQTIIRRVSDAINTTSGGFNWQSAVTPFAGTSVATNWTDTLAAWNEFAVEILAAYPGSFLDFT